MALPASFARDGFVAAPNLRSKRRRLLIGTDGKSNTGKTEFILSIPGPGIVLCVDRGFEAMLDNPHPPKTRCNDYAFKVISAPLSMQLAANSDKETAKLFMEHWAEFYKQYKLALANQDARVVAIDGDSDSWELQRLAHHGKLTQVFPQTRYGDVYAERRAMINRAWDSGKIIVATNRVGDEYLPVLKADGTPAVDEKGEPKRERSGDVTRKGFPDQDYLWQLQLRHYYRPPSVNTVTKKATAGTWGVKILKCKANTEMQGVELEGPDCNFRTLVELIYPQVPAAEWGF